MATSELKGSDVNFHEISMGVKKNVSFEFFQINAKNLKKETTPHRPIKNSTYLSPKTRKVTVVGGDYTNETK